ncbi:Zn(II)2Cys6 transcription factor domain-containing protein [Aspergillus mulundensis]|uniref:Zn(2)-C6 fungal-type domain-containing protein n=1 Tax=Aspergillus mulundensis TaxID=1810919 RepID=A0A3D8R062_9EURO|nr:Uncharacterized protein DSM5745_09319 [Aspergillus mulundensis]RDW67453.1 Uncharacterized protein DSM5745_09319 [Aspergillus mulundensis]
MYKPAPPRPKKTNIVRSRNGCRTCRERKIKCDEKKPACGTCVRLGKPCTRIQPAFEFRTVTIPPPVHPQSSTTSPSVARLPPDGHHEEERHTSTIPSIGCMDLIKSLQHSERDIYYTTYWEDSCLPALHPIFLALSQVADGKAILRNSILALSSCHFSRQQVERKAAGTSHMHMGSFSPSLSHQTRSHLYYSSAIKEITRIDPETVLRDFTIIIGVLTLFTYIESSVGNFQGFRCHVDGMSQLLQSHADKLNDPMNTALVMAWMQIRFVNWWSRAYFSSWEVHRRLPSVPLPRFLEGRPESPQSRRVLVLSILCESHRLHSGHVLGCLGRGAGVDPQADIEHFEQKGELEECLYLLHEQKRRLDEWLARLPPSEWPLSDHGDCLSNDPKEPEDHATPVHFHSHDAALNFAYYALARVMQCDGLLRSLQHRSLYRLYDYEEEESWIRLLLRITNGTDIQTSLARNNYTIGFQGLLLAALLRCQSPALGAAIQSWVQNLANLQPTEEGSFPIYQTLGVIKAINRQKQAGLDVLGVTQPVDDGGGTPKVTAFNSQPIDRLVLHGRSRRTGVPFAECVCLDI